MKRSLIKLVPLYEVVRLLVLSRTAQGVHTGDLPLSWFASAPLLVFPPVLMVLYLFDTENPHIYARLFMLAKLVSAIGIAAWCITRLSASLSEFDAATGYPLFRVILTMVLFLVIDGILVVALFKQNFGRKKETDVISD